MQGPVEQQVGYLVKRLQQQIRSALDARLARHGVSMATYAALSVLEHDPGLSNAELARRCFVTPQTMSELVGDLEEAGLLARRAHPQHGRIIETRLTDRGRELVDACHQEVEALHAVMLADLSDTETAQLTDLLRRCSTALEPQPDDDPAS